MSLSLPALAEQIARDAHKGQTRRDGVTPYINHVIDVVSRLEKQGADPEVLAAAWLHDVLEDTPLTLGSLYRQGLPNHVVWAVLLLSRTPLEPEEYYIANIQHNPIARQVKIADMLSNLSDQPTNKQIRKYARGLLALTEE